MKDPKEILAQMTLEEKASLCDGADFWHMKGMEKYDIPCIMVCDGPHGLRKKDYSKKGDSLSNSVPAISYPTAATTACSWDPELLYEMGVALGKKCLKEEVGVLLGPGINMKRSPLCGRNFEYFSEAPYLCGKIAAAYVRGIQSNGRSACPKHFACNNQEVNRNYNDSRVSQRALREIYLRPFEYTVRKGGAKGIMTSYNKINGTHASDSKELLTDILRSEWGFDGLVVTDWGALNDRIEGYKAGCDLNMPGGSGFMAKECVLAVKNGTLSETDIDNSVRRILKQVFCAVKTLKIPVSCDYDAHHAVTREAAEAGAVLLKNEDAILPLNTGTKIAVIGAMAKNMPMLFCDKETGYVKYGYTFRGKETVFWRSWFTHGFEAPSADQKILIVIPAPRRMFAVHMHTLFATDNVTFISEVGGDRVGDIILNFMKDNGISTDNVKVYPDRKSPISLAFLNERNDAEYLFYKDYPNNRLEVEFPKIGPGDIVLYGSYFVLNPVLRAKTKAFLEYAHEQGALLYYDINFRKTHAPERIKLAEALIENLEFADIVRGSADDFTYLYGMTDAQKIYNEKIKFYCRNFIFTSGAGDVQLFTRDGVGVYPVKKVDVVSTVGAGDNFNAGVVYALAKNGVEREMLPQLTMEQWNGIISGGLDFSAHACTLIENYVDKEWAAAYVKGK